MVPDLSAWPAPRWIGSPRVVEGRRHRTQHFLRAGAAPVYEDYAMQFMSLRLPWLSVADNNRWCPEARPASRLIWCNSGFVFISVFSTLCEWPDAIVMTPGLTSHACYHSTPQAAAGRWAFAPSLWVHLSLRRLCYLYTGTTAVLAVVNTKTHAKTHAKTRKP